MSFQVRLGPCFTLTFQGGTITGSMTTGTGLPVGVMARGPAIGWANLPAEQRCDTQVVAGGGIGITGETSIGMHDTAALSPAHFLLAVAAGCRRAILDFDPNTGEQVGPADPRRRVEP